MLQFFLLIISLNLAKEIVTAFPVELPFELPSLQKVDIRKPERQQDEFESDEKLTFTKFANHFYLLIIIFIVLNCFV